VKPARRDPLRELVGLLRVPEEGAHNLGAFLVAHADDLAAALGSNPEDLRGSAELPDEVVAPRVRARLGRRRELEQDKKAQDDAETAVRAATVLGRTVRWAEQGAVLDTELLLGDLLADRAKKYVSLAGPDFTTAIERATLARTAMLRRMFIDVAAYVDADGLHVRWRGGRGGYNWKPQIVVPADRAVVLEVALQPPLRAAVPRSGAWLGDVLRQVGFAV
jgi:hypothetical protein